MQPPIHPRLDECAGSLQYLLTPGPPSMHPYVPRYAECNSSRLTSGPPSTHAPKHVLIPISCPAAERFEGEGVPGVVQQDKVILCPWRPLSLPGSATAAASARSAHHWPQAGLQHRDQAAHIDKHIVAIRNGRFSEGPVIHPQDTGKLLSAAGSSHGLCHQCWEETTKMRYHSCAGTSCIVLSGNVV